MYQKIVQRFQDRLKIKFKAVRDYDLEIDYEVKN